MRTKGKGKGKGKREDVPPTGYSDPISRKGSWPTGFEWSSVPMSGKVENQSGEKEKEKGKVENQPVKVEFEFHPIKSSPRPGRGSVPTYDDDDLKHRNKKEKHELRMRSLEGLLQAQAEGLFVSKSSSSSGMGRGLNWAVKPCYTNSSNKVDFEFYPIESSPRPGRGSLPADYDDNPKHKKEERELRMGCIEGLLQAQAEGLFVAKSSSSSNGPWT